MFEKPSKWWNVGGDFSLDFHLRRAAFALTGRVRLNELLRFSLTLYQYATRLVLHHERGKREMRHLFKRFIHFQCNCIH